MSATINNATVTRTGFGLLTLVLLVPLVSGCSLKKMALNSVAESLAKSDGAYASDPDPELIESASPFGLKLMESLLVETPENPHLLLALVRGFTQYTYAYVDSPADELELRDVSAAYTQRERAKALYFRARDYGIRGLNTIHPGFEEGLRKDAVAACARIGAGEVPLLYWSAAAWGAATALGKDDPALLGDIPILETMAARVLELDEEFDSGAGHTLMMSLVMAIPGSGKLKVDAAAKHFVRSVEISGGMLAAPYVAYAESVAVATGDREGYTDVLNRALAIQGDALPDSRLSNTIFQRRATWLLEHVDLFFIQ